MSREAFKVYSCGGIPGGVEVGGGIGPDDVAGGDPIGELAAAAPAAMAAPGNIPNGLPPGPGPPMNIIALAFSAAAAAAMRLLFSASESRGDLKRKLGSIPGGSG